MSAFRELEPVIDDPMADLMVAATVSDPDDVHPLLHPDRARAARLRDEAQALSAVPDPEVGSDGSGVLMALDECVGTLIDHESERVERALRQDRVLSACVEDLGSKGDGARASSTAAALRGLADRLDQIADRPHRGASAATAIRRSWASLAAITLAGAALFGGALLLPEPAWELPSLAIVATGSLGLILGRLFGGRADRGSADRAEIDQRAQEVLARARIVITDSTRLDAQSLREYAEQVGRRDLIASLRTRLEKLLLAEDERHALREVRTALSDDLTPTQKDEFVARRAHQPVLAMPGLASAVGDAFSKGAAAAHRRGSAEGLRRGLSEALVREADYLEERADRADREREAESLWRRMTPVEERPAIAEIVEAEAEPAAESAPPEAPTVRSTSLRSRGRHPLQRVPASSDLTVGPAAAAAAPSLRLSPAADLRRPPSRLLKRPGCVAYVPPPPPPIVPVDAPTAVEPALSLSVLQSRELPECLRSNGLASPEAVNAYLMAALNPAMLPAPVRPAMRTRSYPVPAIPALDAAALPTRTRTATRIAHLSVWPPADALRDVARRAVRQVDAIQRAVHAAISSN